MKGIVLAGGTGSRMQLFTKRVGNKHVIPCYRRPMIEYPLSLLSQAGIKDVAIVTGHYFAGQILSVIGNGREFGFNNTSFFYQFGNGGIADALKLTRSFVGQDSCCVVLGDNLLEDNISGMVRAFEEDSCHAAILLKTVSDPQRYGVAELQGSKIVSIEEKPKQPKSDSAIIGVYFFDNSVFRRAEILKPSARGELEITDILTSYMNDEQLRHYCVSGFWNDMGTHSSLLESANWLKENEQSLKERGRFSAYKFQRADGTLGDYLD